MSLAESQEFFALNPDDLSGPAEQDRSGGSIWPTLRGRLQQEGVGSKKLLIFFQCSYGRKCQQRGVGGQNKPKTCQYSL